MSKSRVVYAIFKRKRAKEGADEYGVPYPPGPVMIDSILGNEDRAYGRKKELQNDDFEVSLTEWKTNPTEDEMIIRQGVNVEKLFNWITT